MKKFKIIGISLALAMIIAGCVIIGVVIAMPDKPKKKGYSFNKFYANETLERLESAELLPKPEALVRTAAEGEENISLGKAEYQKLLGSMTEFCGTESMPDRSIYDIVDEIYYAVSIVPMFGRWFKLPVVAKWETDSEGWNNYYYNFGYNEQTRAISIQRLSFPYNASAYDASADKILCAESGDSVALQQYLKADLYFNSKNKQVVEISLTDFIVVNGTYHTVQTQYLKHVSGSLFLEVKVDLQKQLTAYASKVESGSRAPYDIDTVSEGGACRRIVQIDYSSNETEVLIAEQNFATDYYTDIATTHYALLIGGENSLYLTETADHYLSQSADYLPLRCMFKVDEESVTKEQLAEVLTATNYLIHPTLGSAGNGSSTVCGVCFDGDLDSGRLVYKCKHNISDEFVTRAGGNFVSKTVSFDAAQTIFEEKIMNAARNLLGSSQSTEKYAASLKTQLAENENAYYDCVERVLGKIATEFLNNVGPCNSVQTISDNVTASHADINLSDLSFNNVSTELELADIRQGVIIQDNKIFAEVSAKIKNSLLLKVGEMYSVSLVLYSDTGVMIPLISDSGIYSGHDMAFILSGSYDMNNFTSEEIVGDFEATFRFGIAITKPSEGRTLLCSRLYVSKIYSEFEGLAFDETVGDFIRTCEFKLNANELTLFIKSTPVPVDPAEGETSPSEQPAE